MHVYSKYLLLYEIQLKNYYFRISTTNDLSINSTLIFYFNIIFIFIYKYFMYIYIYTYIYI